MNYFGQNLEDKIVHELFGDFKGSLLDIGANSGDFLSNSLALINLGWSATLVEPSSVFNELTELHKYNYNVTCYNYGIGSRDETVTFYESGAHVLDGSDNALVSTVNYNETLRWRNAGVQFTEKTINLVSWFTFMALNGSDAKFDFISIDAEGMDWEILNQIDLEAVSCKVLCIEWNGVVDLLHAIAGYCKGFKLVHQNNENLIFSKI